MSTSRAGITATCDQPYIYEHLPSPRTKGLFSKNNAMESRNIAQIAVAVCDLLQQQLDSIVDRKLTDLTPEELNAYKKRKSEIEELHAELRRLASPM